MARARSGTRSGSTAGAEIVGGREFRRELKKLDDPRAWSKELSMVNKAVSKKAEADARAEARSMGGMQRHFAEAIVGKGTVAGARLQIANEDAYGAFWGAKQHTGWNVGNATPNLPSWVGNTWGVGEFGGPYALNDAIRSHIDEYLGIYWSGVTEITHRAFPSP